MPKNKTTDRDELEAMTKEDLVDLATDRGLTVTRGDGSDGEPLKADYVNALSSDTTQATTSGQKSSAPRLDETIPGGRYTNESGQTVNAEGKRIDDKGKLLDAAEE